MTVELLAPGLLTSVQDAGRHGARALGVGVAGAVDGYSLAIANLLVGNPAGAAALELTLAGPTLRLHRAATIAICGAMIDAQVDGASLPGWRPIALRAGSTIALGRCRAGARAFLAIDGGIDVPVVLGSRSTDLRAGFGGHEGRALCTGDRIATFAAGGGIRPWDSGATASSSRGATSSSASTWIAPWWIDPAPDLAFEESCAVRVLAGADATAPPDALLAQEFVVDAASNRQGLRLKGCPGLQIDERRERISEPVVPGTVQLPPDGHPIVLLADAQTVGGYPRIAHVIAADLPRLAQRRAGQRLRFVPVDDAQAARANALQRARMARIALAIGSRRHST